MSIAFVTSMNQKIYEDYGKRYIEEFSNNADTDINLYVVFEKNFPGDIGSLKKNIFIVPFANPSHNQFIEYFGKLYEAAGIKINVFNDMGQKKINIKNDYRYNAIKFSFKPFSIHQIINYLPSNLDYLIWTDADLRCKKLFYQKDLLQFLPQENELISYLGRKYIYSECGFMGFNLKHSKTLNFISDTIHIYCSGKIFSFDEWHDCFTFDFLRNEYESQDLKFRNISGKGYEVDHPFVNSGLEEFFDHLKGDERKSRGNSFESDYLDNDR